MPPSVIRPVIPEGVNPPAADPGFWSRPPLSRDYTSQAPHRMPSQSHPPPQMVNPAVMPSRPYTEPTTSSPTSSSSFSSPPFKPFQPLPEIRRSKPPTPPPKLLDLPPYRDTLSHLSHPTPGIRSEALEIIRDREKTNIHKAHEEWRKQDERRERIIREKKEERERLISGASTIRAPTMQTVTTLVVDPTTVRQAPPPPPPPKEKRPFWRRLFHSGRPNNSQRQPMMSQPLQANGHVVIPIDPQHAITTIQGVVVPMQVPSQPQTSSSSTWQGSGDVPQTQAPPVIPVTPGRRYSSNVIPGAVGPQVAMPSPSVYPKRRSTTPDFTPPPTAAFFSIPAQV